MHPTIKDLLKPSEEDGGITEYPHLQLLLQASENTDIYFAIIDYVLEHPKEGNKQEYQYFIKLNKVNDYVINDIEEVEYPIDFKLFNY